MLGALFYILAADPQSQRLQGFFTDADEMQLCDKLAIAVIDRGLTADNA